MKKYLVIMVLATACGSSPQRAQTSGASTTVYKDGAVSYDLTATANSKGPTPVSLSVTESSAVIMPATISALSNASAVLRADLTIGSVTCSYQNDGDGVYVRQDGSCNTLTPDAAVSLVAGDTLSLTLEGCPNQPTSIEAIITGETN